MSKEKMTGKKEGDTSVLPLSKLSAHIEDRLKHGAVTSLVRMMCEAKWKGGQIEFNFAKVQYADICSRPEFAKQVLPKKRNQLLWPELKKYFGRPMGGEVAKKIALNLA